MQKTTTLKDFKVFLLKTFLATLVLGLSFQVSFAQSFGNPNKKNNVQGPRTQTATITPVVTKATVKADQSLLSANKALTSVSTDVPELNRQIAEKMAKSPVTARLRLNSPTTNIVTDVCTFNGSLLAGDNTMASRLSRPGGTGSLCGAPQPYPGAISAGPYFYDTYTMTNSTCATACVTVTLTTNDLTNANIQVGAWLGSFNPANLATNYIGDPYVSTGTPAPPAGISFAFNLAANATVVFAVWSTNANTAASGTANDYTMTVSGLTCSTPPPCTPIGPSVLSQRQIPAPPVNLYNEGFNTSVVYPGSAVPAGWAFALRSNPPGLITVWYSGNQTGVFPGNTGDYIAANYNHAGAALGTLSSWLFAPTTAMKNGDKFSFYTRHDPGNARPDRLQVRMSTNGASTNVGATETSVGDFTTLLLDINPTYQTTGYPTVWQQYTVTISGLPPAGIAGGRIAFRYFCEQSGGVGVGTNSDYIGIDDAVYTTYPTINPTTCVGSTVCLNVDIQGGAPGATYNVTLNRNPPGGPGGNFTINNYTSGDCIPVSPVVNTTYSIVSIIDASNPCCIGTGNSGTPTVVVAPGPVAGITIVDNPTGPLCAGDPKLLTVIGAPSSGSSVTASGNVNILIPDGSAVGATSTLAVAGIPGGATATSANVLFNMTHTWDGDMTIFLKSPNNQILNLVDSRGSLNDNFTNTNINSTSLVSLATGTAPFTGTFMADGTSTLTPTGYGAPTAATFPAMLTATGTNLNGNWVFGMRDNAGGDQGTLINWTLTLNYSVPAGPPVGYTFLWSPAAGLSSTTSNPVAASPSTTRQYTVVGTAPGGCQTAATILITVNQLPAVVTNPSNVTVCAGASASFTVGGTGAGITYQWQVSTTGAGGPWSNLTNTAPYSGVTTATLTVNPTTNALNGNRYRCVISGTCPPAANSVSALLTVNPLPNVTISPASPTCGGVAGISGTALTASGANTYVWTPNGAGNGLYTNNTATTLYTGTNLNPVYAAPATNTIYTVTGTTTATGCTNTATINVVYTPPAPTVSPASVAMCNGDAAVQLCVTSSLVPAPFTQTFTSGPISVIIPDNDQAGAFSTIASTLPGTAQITNARVTLNMSHTWAGDVVMALKAPNNNILNLDYAMGNTGGSGATTGFVNTVISSTGVAALSSGTNPYTGTFKADAATGAFSGPLGFLATGTTWNQLYSTPAGNWTLGMWDAGAGDQGTLTSWSITFDYLYGPPAQGTWSPAAGLYTDAAATIPYVAGTPATCVYTRPSPFGVYNYSVTVTSVGFDAHPVFTNPAPIAINDGTTSTPYPVNLTVSGIPAVGAVVENVKLMGLSHTWESDIAIALQSPTAQNTILMASVGGANAVSNVTYTIQDGAPAFTGGANPTGTYSPTNLGGSHNFPTLGAQNAANPLSSFTGNMNGVWKLYIIDEFLGDFGSISGGYSIQFKHPTVGCTSPARTVTVTVNTQAIINAQPASTAVCTDKVATFTVGATIGLGSIAYQWEVSTDNGNTYNSVPNSGVYSGANTPTLTITAPPVSMNGYVYRCKLQGPAPCPPVYSFFRILTVWPLPTIVISASPYTKLFPGLITTLSSTVSPFAAATYTWLRNGIAVAGATTQSLSVDVDGLGDYTLKVTDVNGCTNTSNMVSITDSVTGRLFIYPNPNSGIFQVRYYSVANNVLPRGLTIYDAKGSRIAVQNYTITAPYSRMDVDLRKYGKGVYWIELGDLNGNRLAVGRAVVQ